MNRIFTCGTFDLFHLGHLYQLENASKLGDELIVGVSSDFLNLKKKSRLPIVPLQQRIQIICGLKSVDKVFVEEEYTTESKLEYARLYNSNHFTIGDDWKGKFDNNCLKVTYLPRTPYLSTTQTIQIFGSNLSIDINEIKPVIRLDGSLSYSILLKDISLDDFLPFIGLFKNVYIRNDCNHTISDISLPNVKPYKDNESTTSLTIDKSNFSKKNGLYVFNINGLTFNIPIIYDLVTSTPSQLLWQMNQRLNDEMVYRPNILIRLNSDNLSIAKRHIVNWLHRYNIIVIPDKDEKGISYPDSTLEYLFWQSIREKTCDYLTILPTNYYVHIPNLYYYCDVLITDRYDELSNETIDLIYDINLINIESIDIHYSNHQKLQNIDQRINMIKSSLLKDLQLTENLN